MNAKINGVKRLEKLNLTKKIVIVGIGNYDRADDYAGIAVIEELEKNDFPINIRLINAGSVPEAFTGVIKREEPAVLIVIDAAQMNEIPGTIRVFTEKEINDAYMVTPHKTSMTMFTKYLRFFIKNLKAIFIGIEPFSLSYMKEMDPRVKGSVKYLGKYLKELLLRE